MVALPPVRGVAGSVALGNQQTRVYPYPLCAGSARPNPKMGAPDPENPLFIGFSVLSGGLRPWSQTMVLAWGRGRSGDCEETLSPSTGWSSYACECRATLGTKSGNSSPLCLRGCLVRFPFFPKMGVREG